MKVVYIAAPYRADTINGIYNNIQEARLLAIKYWKKGHAVICPHMNSSLMDGVIPDEMFLSGGIEILKRCDIIVFSSRWKWSLGCYDEHKIAMESNLQIIYEE